MKSLGHMIFLDTGYILLLEYMLYNLVRLLPSPLISILKDQIHCSYFYFLLNFFTLLNLSLLLIWLLFTRLLRIMNLYMPFVIYVG